MMRLLSNIHSLQGIANEAATFALSLPRIIKAFISTIIKSIVTCYKIIEVSLHTKMSKSIISVMTGNCKSVK
jgi:hypothetical protein